jgi:mRNA-degrading endonuclease YafQ of YafQ-DinJ toxin-antitoxin module
MIIYYSSKFEREYRKLPLSVKKEAEKREQQFRKNPYDPRLNTHKLTGKLNLYWSFSIDYQYRIVFEFAQQTVWFHSVGTHDIYRNR